MNNECIQGFYCTKLEKSYIGLKRPFWDKILLFLGVDERKSKWKVIGERGFKKTYHVVGKGILNAGKDYGTRSENGIIQIIKNGIGEEIAYEITSHSKEEVNLEWAKNFLKK